MQMIDIEDEPRRFNLFATVQVSGYGGVGELVDLVREARTAVPGQRVLVTLDDSAQASYTSMHAWEADKLEIPDDAWDAPGPDEEWDEATSERFELAQASHLAHALVAQRGAVDLTGIAAKLGVDAHGIAALVQVNRQPELILDDVAELLTVPVDADDLVLAGAPNGYFSEDLDVFANHAIAWHLQQRFGLRLFGEGAAWLGFERAAVLLPGEAAELVADLALIYGNSDAPAWADLVAALTGRDVVLFGYSANFPDSAAPRPYV